MRASRNHQGLCAHPNLPAHLLRGHVDDCPHRRPGACGNLCGFLNGGHGGVGWGLLLHQFGQPEVQHFGLSLLGNEEVGRFDISMDNRTSEDEERSWVVLLKITHTFDF